MSLPHDYPVGKVDAGRSDPITSSTFTVYEGQYVAGDTVNMTQSQGLRQRNPATAVISFPVGNILTARIKLVGASGGAGGGYPTYGNNSNGGTIDVSVSLGAYAGQTLYFYFGGCGQAGIGDDSGGTNCQGGYNGGGSASNGAGGGRTDLRTVSGTPTSEILVAGGGGGWSGSGGISGTRYQAASQVGCVGLYDPDTGYTFEGSGGGGGYFAGNGDCNDVGANAGAGSNYILSSIQQTVHQNQRVTSTSGGNQGCGWATLQVLTVS